MLVSLPGDTEGDGGLQKSSKSVERPHTLSAELSGDFGEKSAASARWESGERPHLSGDLSVPSGSLSTSERTHGGQSAS